MWVILRNVDSTRVRGCLQRFDATKELADAVANACDLRCVRGVRLLTRLPLFVFLSLFRLTLPSLSPVFLRTMHLHLLHKYIQDLGLHGVGESTMPTILRLLTRCAGSGSPTPPSTEDKSIQWSVSVTDKAVDTSEQDCELSSQCLLSFFF